MKKNIPQEEKGFPVAYEIYPWNTRDTATLEEFLDRIEKQYGKFRHIWPSHCQEPLYPVEKECYSF